MYIYYYSKDTVEYLYKSIAESDSASTFTSGEFTPLVPAYATLLVLPAAGENQATVFTDTPDNWIAISRGGRISVDVAADNILFESI